MKIRSIEISDQVADVLRRSRIEQFLVVLPEQLERKAYEAVDKVLKALGGKWNRKMAGHLFPADIRQPIEQALRDGSAIDRKKTLELFQTPEELALRMAAIVEDRMANGIRILEPSAGMGRLLWALSRSYSLEEVELLAIDIDAANCEHLRVQGIATEVICGDFLDLACQIGKQADVILMNPPFGDCADITHVTHAYTSWLASGGVLVAIMSPHFTFAEDRKSVAFRDLMASLPYGSAVVDLPAGTFKGEGTQVSTVLVTMRKGS